jgi:hypothetical protein
MRFGTLLGFGLPAVLLTQCAPQCAPPPAPAVAPAAATFGAGTKIVGRDVQPGTYYATSAGGCYWERLSGLSGDFDDIITNDFETGQHMVTIEATDAAFDSDSDCGTWTLYSGGAGATDRITAGDWHVGQHMAPGRWATEGPAQGCYWERGSGFTHELTEIVANDFGDGQRVVDISPTDVRFSTSDRCGAWVRIG